VEPTKLNFMGRSKGGLLVCVRRNRFKILKYSSTSSYIILTVQNIKTSQTLKICFSYLAPYGSIDESEVESVIEAIKVLSPTLIMGDFNARVGNLNFNKETRSSKDMIVNSRGAKLLSKLDGYKICNGVATGDLNGDCTFVNKNGSSVVDLCLYSNESFSNVKSFEVLNSELSHHMPIKVTVGRTELRSCAYSVQRIKWKNELKLKFLQQLHKHRGNQSVNSFDQMCSLLYKSANSAGLQTESRVGECRSTLLWEDPELKRLKSNYRFCVKKFRQCDPFRNIESFAQCKNNMLYAKAQYLEISQAKKEKYFKSLYLKIINCKNSSEFWSALLS